MTQNLDMYPSTAIMVISFDYHRWLWWGGPSAGLRQSHPRNSYPKPLLGSIIITCSWIFITSWTLVSFHWCSFCNQDFTVNILQMWWMLQLSSHYHSGTQEPLISAMSFIAKSAPQALRPDVGSSWITLSARHSWVGYFIFIIHNQYRFLFSSKYMHQTT